MVVDITQPSLQIALIAGRLHVRLEGANRTICELPWGTSRPRHPHIALLSDYPWCPDCRDAYHRRPVVQDV